MSIFSQIFGGAPTSQPPVNPAPGANPALNPSAPMSGTQASAGTAPNGVVPANTGTPTNSESSEKPAASPLDAFSEVWKIDPTKTNQESSQVFQGVDPAKLMESAGKVDFAKVISQDDMQKIQAGGADAMSAMISAMNKVAQTVYGQSALATTKIVQQALDKAQSSYDAKIPDMVRKLSANESLRTENPLLSNPAVQPLVDALTQQLIQKNPNATSNEISQQVKDYFDAVAQSLGKKTEVSQTSGNQSAGGNTMDWSKFLEE